MTSSSVLNENSGATGPNVSSRAIFIFDVTPVRMVGSKNEPPSACRLPPSAILPPLLTASAMCSSTFSTAAMSISGPCWVSPLSPSPTFMALTAFASFSAKAS